jgi:small-conductance mechanosensitive channel
MPTWIQVDAETGRISIAGIRLVGVTADNGGKLLLSLLLIVLALVLSRLLRFVAGLILRGRDNARADFWTRQGVNLFTAALILFGIASIWFDDPTTLTTGLGLISAGLAFALQKVITAIAGYFVILRGKTFNVGDRIVMGGVRGDVIALGFTQTTIMEMGQPPPVQNATPAMWVQSRQYTGRVVTVSNAKVFDEPVFNYSRDFPYIWEEMHVPIGFNADLAGAERILLEAATRHAVRPDIMTAEAWAAMQKRYMLSEADLKPRVYYRLTDNWMELTVRFLTGDRGVRDVKDAMSRDVIAGLNAAGIGIASSTLEIVGLPPVRTQTER